MSDFERAARNFTTGKISFHTACEHAEMTIAEFEMNYKKWCRERTCEEWEEMEMKDARD